MAAPKLRFTVLAASGARLCPRMLFALRRPLRRSSVVRSAFVSSSIVLVRLGSMPAISAARVGAFFCLAIAEFASGLRQAPAGEDGIRRQLLRAQRKFSEASDAGGSALQRSIDAELESAVASPSQTGSALDDQSDTCFPDLSGCPVGWTTQGGLCVAEGGYDGPCATSLSLGGLGAPEKLALARVCGLAFPCRASALRQQSRSQATFGHLSEVESVLMRGCGDSCLKLFHSLAGVAHDSGEVVWASNTTSANEAALRRAALRGLEELRVAQQASALATSGSAESLMLHAREAVVSAHQGAELADTPCATPAACAMKERVANRCNYGRAALLSAYNDVNVLVHVLGAMVSTLCGCVHVQQVSHCALHQVPQACIFPYTVYSKAFAGSAQLWEAVKASTSKCSIHAVHPSAA